MFTLLLAQGGEFAFVVFQAAAGAQVFSAETASLLIGAVALSMLISPLLLVLVDRALLRRYAQRQNRRPARARDLGAAGSPGHHRRLRPLRADRGACDAGPGASPPPC